MVTGGEDVESVEGHGIRVAKGNGMIELLKTITLGVGLVGLLALEIVRRVWRTISQLSIPLALIVAIVLLLSGSRPLAQGRAMATFTDPQPITSVIALPALVAPTKKNYLVWDYQPDVTTYRVQVGSSRGSYTNTFTIATNRFPLTNGLSYAVWSVANGAESLTPSLWPSNKVERIWVQTATNLTTWTDAFIWTTNYNKPQEYLRLRSELIRWE